MAGDWIKLESVTPDKPEVFRISEALCIDPDAALGKLVRVWIWADQQTIDGNAVGVTKSAIDRIAHTPGFADAMISVGWLSGVDSSLMLVRFDRHNGKGAKKRALTNQRVSDHRVKATQSGAKCNADSVSESVTREEKRILESKASDDESPDTKPKRKVKVDPVPYAEILAAYCEALPTLPQPQGMTPKRKSMARAIWNDLPKSHEPDFWRRYFKYIAGTPFLCEMNCAANALTSAVGSSFPSSSIKLTYGNVAGLAFNRSWSNAIIPLLRKIMLSILPKLPPLKFRNPVLTGAPPNT